MRRLDYADKPEGLDRILAGAHIGQLGIIDPAGYPRVVPVNFAWSDGVVYFHGASAGEKFEVFRAGRKVSFTAYLEFSSAPSYWRSPEYACPSTIYYKSACVKGRGVVAEDPAEKATALNKLMKKYQPEGGYKLVTVDDPLYRKAMLETTVFKVVPESFDVKNKMGQNLSPDVRVEIIKRLRERGAPLDLLTAEEMEKTL